MKAIKQMIDEMRNFLWGNRWHLAAFSTLLLGLYLFAVWVFTPSPESLAKREAQAKAISRGEYGVRDLCMYQGAMLSCLEKLPKGAERLTASGNDWDEVAEVCKDFASRASYRMAKYVKEECR